MTFSQFATLIKFDGELIAELIERWTGLDFDICLNETEQNDFSWLNIESIERIMSRHELPESITVGDSELKVKTDLSQEWFGLKMIASGYIYSNENVIDAIPKLLAVYHCSEYYESFKPEMIDELSEIISEMPAVTIYPIGKHYIQMLKGLNEYQAQMLKIDESYQTQEGREKRNLIHGFGINRLEKFGDMNLIDDFCTAFPAYKHDDVFKLEFSFVIDRLSRIEVINNITEQLMQFYHDKAKKQ